MNDKEWPNYSVILKQGFVKSREYLQDKFSLLEKASLTLKDSFSIEYILLFCMNKNNLTELTFDKRKDFMKNLFEIYFRYAMNLLLYFDIYSEKSIADNTSQMVNYLVKIPQSSTHLGLIGYTYRSDIREWKYSEPRLTTERKEILGLITICSCLGYNYLDQPLKYLKLSVFEKRRESLHNFIEERICDYCNFKFNKIDLCCSVCNQGIETMDFFQHWEINYNATVKEIQNTIYTHNDIIEYDSIKRQHSLPEQCADTWQCSKCTLMNPISHITCCACHSLNDNASNGDATRLSLGNNDSLSNLANQTNDNQRSCSLPILDREMWQCSICSLNNQMTNVTCNVCMNPRADTQLIPNNKERTTHTESRGNGLSPLIEKWLCPDCTFLNDIGSYTCNACFAPKGDLGRPAICNSTLSGITEESIKSNDIHSSCAAPQGLMCQKCSIANSQASNLAQKDFLLSKNPSSMDNETETNLFIRFLHWLSALFKCW